MKFTIKTEEGSILKFRTRTREDGSLSLSISEVFKGNQCALITTRITKETLNEWAERMKLSLYDIENPRNADTTPEEHQRMRRERLKLAPNVFMNKLRTT